MSVLAEEAILVDPKKMLANMLVDNEIKLPNAAHDKVHKNVCVPILEIVEWCLAHEADIQDMYLHFNIGCYVPHQPRYNNNN